MSDAPPPAEPPPPDGDAPAEKPPAEVRPSPPRRAGPRPWQGGRYHSTTRRGPGGRLRAILILLAVILALAGAVVAWVLYPGSVPRPYFIALAVEQYTDTDSRIPPNQWTAQDREALRGRGWPGSNAATSQQKDRLVQELRNLGRNQPADQPLVIYFRGYALPAGDRGDLAVLPADANLDDENSWLPLKDVFGFIKDCPARPKLLLLDVAQPFADARAGAVANDAAARAEPIVKQALEEDKDLLVLCSCSPGQTSLASEEMGHTVFVHYLLEGLAGAADGWGGGVQDNRVSVRELAAYTAANVDRWASHNRGARQTPVLLGRDGMDFGLTVDKSAAPDLALDKDYPQWLKDAWDQRDRWAGDLRVPTPAALYRDLERDALRAEAQWRGGAKPEEVQSVLKGRTDTLAADPRRRRPAGAPVRDSLALAVAEGRKAPARDRTENAVFQLCQMAKLLPPPPPKTGPPPPPDPTAEAKLDVQKKAFLNDFDNQPFELAYVVVQAAKATKKGDDAGPDAALPLWLSLLRPEMGKAPDYEELHILALLASLEAKDPQKEWSEVVSPAVGLAEEAAQAHADLDLCPPGPLTDRLREWGDQSDAARQTAEDALRNANPADRAKAVKRLDPAQAGARSYPSLRNDARVLRDALRCRDDALTLLPGYAAYLEHDAGPLEEWELAVKQTALLREHLATPPADGPPPEWFSETDRLARPLRESLKNLLRPVNSRLPAPNPPNPKAGAADAEDMRAMLRLPALSAKDRVALWDAWRALAERLNQETTAPSGPGAEPLSPPDLEKAKKDERDLALLRARVSLDLLKLDGADGDAVKNVQAALDKAAQNPADAKALPELGRALRAGWKQLEATHGH